MVSLGPAGGALPLGGALVGGAPSLGGGGGAMGGGEDRALKEMIEAKERELSELGDYRLAQLEAAVRDRDARLAQRDSTLEKLKEDFSYNLALIGERDGELPALEQERSTLQGELRDRDARIDALETEVADREKALEGGNSSAAEREAYWQTRLGEVRSECDALRWEAKETARAAKECDAALRLDHATKVRDQGRKRVIQRRFNVGVLEAIPKRKASTL